MIKLQWIIRNFIYIKSMKYGYLSKHYPFKRSIIIHLYPLEIQSLSNVDFIKHILSIIFRLNQYNPVTDYNSPMIHNIHITQTKS